MYTFPSQFSVLRLSGSRLLYLFFSRWFATAMSLHVNRLASFHFFRQTVTATADANISIEQKRKEKKRQNTQSQKGKTSYFSASTMQYFSFLFAPNSRPPNTYRITCATYASCAYFPFQFLHLLRACLLISTSTSEIWSWLQGESRGKVILSAQTLT